MVASLTMSRKCARQSPGSRIATIVIGVLKNWASEHPHEARQAYAMQKAA